MERGQREQRRQRGTGEWPSRDSRMRVTTGSAPGCAEGGPAEAGPMAHRVRCWVAGGAGLLAHTPGAVDGGAHTPGTNGESRPALSRGRVVLRYSRYRTDSSHDGCVTRPPQGGASG